MRAPDFWRGDGPLPRLLAPAGAVYAAAGRLRRLTATPVRLPVPVICVGNLVAGGAGKTPVALSLAARLRSWGLAVHLLTRGYGGQQAGPLLVDVQRHGFRDVGDEALLLARAAPTWVARDRAAGGRAALAAGAQAIVLDDGHQNPSLKKDLSLVVVDAAYGFGNGRVMPAGPLREPVAGGLARADAVILLGDGGAAPALSGFAGPILRAELHPGPEAAELAGRRVVAFAGIGRPEKFFDTLAGLGAELGARFSFPDHHPYRPADLMPIFSAAERAAAVIVTTEKDAVRLPPEAAGRVRVLTVTVAWNDPDRLEKLLSPLTARRGVS